MIIAALHKIKKDQWRCHAKGRIHFMYTMFTIMMVMKPQHCLQRKKNTILRDRLCKSTSAVVTIAKSKTTKNILSGLKFILALDVVSYKWKIMY